jgi:hypothetical protein
MISSTVWDTFCLVVLPGRTRSVACHHPVGSHDTVAVPYEWLTRSAIHCSCTVAVCLDVL